MLQVNNLTKYYSDTETSAIQDVSFSLGPKKILSVFGSSGSGKTTLLKTIAGLIQPDQGVIKLNDEIIKGPDDLLVPGHEEIKVVFQDFNLKSQMTVEENVNYALLSYENDYRLHRLKVVLDLCLLNEFKDQYIHQLSGGQKQRVAIARAIANEPKLVLMDEPFSNLDLKAKNSIRFTIQNIINESDSSILFVSHDPEEVLMISDEVIVLEKGCIKQVGTPIDIYKRPNSLSIAEMFSPIVIISKNGKTVYYRPEALTMVTIKDEKSDLNGKVIGSKSLGKYQLLEVSTNASESNPIICYDYFYQYQIGDSIKLNLNDPLPIISPLSNYL